MFQAEENLCRQLLVSLHLSAGVSGSQKPQAATNQSHLHFHAAMAPAWPNPLMLIALAFLFYAIGELIPRPRGGSQENRRSAGKARGASSGRPEGENGPRPCHDPGSERRRSPLSLLIGGLLFSGIRATCFRALGRELSQGPPMDLPRLARIFLPFFRCKREASERPLCAARLETLQPSAVEVLPKLGLRSSCKPYVSSNDGLATSLQPPFSGLPGRQKKTLGGINPAPNFI